MTDTKSTVPPRLHYAAIGELEAAFHHRRPLSLDDASPHQWAVACHELFEAGRLDVVEYAVRYLHQIYPELDYLSTLVALFDAVPHHLPEPLAFNDDPAADVQLVRRPDCDKVLLCFCARQGTLGLPLNFVHQWLGRLPSSLVYMKDFRDLYGALGYPSLGGDRESSLIALDRTAQDFGATRIYALGVSLGGYAALYYGLRIGAEAVLSLAGATDLTRDLNENFELVSLFYRNLLAQAPDYARNLQEMYAAAARRPRALLAFSSGHSRDRRQAERMAELPDVELIPVRDYALHNVLNPLIRNGEFLPLLSRLLFDTSPETSTRPACRITEARGTSGPTC